GDPFELLEVDLDQRAPGVAVPEPGEGEAGRRLDLRVDPAAAVLHVLGGVAHDDADGAAHAQVDLRLGRLPSLRRLPPPAHDLLGRPRPEDRLDGRPVGALDAQRSAAGHWLAGSPVAREICSAISAAASGRSYSSWRLHQ